MYDPRGSQLTVTNQPFGLPVYIRVLEIWTRSLPRIHATRSGPVGFDPARKPVLAARKDMTLSPDDFVVRLRAERASAILRCGDADVARNAMEAAVRGGFRIVEFTLTTPGAVDLIREFAARGDVVVGAGTVLTPAQARESVRAGARFLVSPVIDETVVAAARELGVAVIPGTFTPTEMLRAHRAGAPLVKLFPSPGAGPLYIKQILGPLPELRIVPTAGVDASNARAYLEAGAWAVGFVSSLFDAGDLAEQRFDAIERRARNLRGALA